MVVILDRTSDESDAAASHATFLVLLSAFTSLSPYSQGYSCT